MTTGVGETRDDGWKDGVGEIEQKRYCIDMTVSKKDMNERARVSDTFA